MFTLPVQDEGSTERKAEAQVNNPNSTALPQQGSTTPTESVDKLTPNNDQAWRPEGANAPIVDAKSVNSKLLAATMRNPNPGFESLYGMNTNTWIGEDDIMKAPQMIKDKYTGDWMEKKITNDIDEKRRDIFLKDISQINIANKQANSGSGIGLNYGYSYEDSLNMANALMSDSNAKVKEVIDNGTWWAFEWAVASFQNKFKEIQALPKEQQQAAMEHEVAMLKIAMLPIAEKRMSVEFGRNWWINTATTVWLNAFVQWANKVVAAFKANSEELKGYVSNVNDAFNRKVVSYMSLDDSQNRSIYAKQKLKENGSYNTFLDLLAKQNPIFKDKVARIRNSSEISQEEIDIIRSIFEPKYLWPIKEQKAILKERFGSGYANKMFAQYDELFDVVTQSYKTRKDDLYENVDFGNVFQGINMAGYSPTTFMTWSNANQGWQSKKSSYTKEYTPREWYSIGWKAYV